MLSIIKDCLCRHKKTTRYVVGADLQLPKSKHQQDAVHVVKEKDMLVCDNCWQIVEEE